MRNHLYSNGRKSDPDSLNRAINYLIGDEVTAGRRWDVERMRQQLNKPGEDGRVLMALISPLYNRQALSDDEGLELLRGIAFGELNNAAVQAARGLVGLDDRESESKMRALLAEVKTGCRERVKEIVNKEIKYPWISCEKLRQLEMTLHRWDLPTKDRGE